MLFDASMLRMLPDRVVAFASGANRLSEIRGFTRLGIPVGVSAPRLNDPAIQLLSTQNLPVFVDSGAFSEVAFGTGGGVRVVSPILDQEWHRRMVVYLRIGSALGAKSFLIAPDQVGSQQETLRRLRINRIQLARIAATGALLLVPLQVGTMTHRDFYFASLEAAGVPLQPAMPMRKAATSISTLMDFIGDVRPAHIHLLGMGLESKRGARTVRLLQGIQGSLSISLDSNRLRSFLGRSRPLTKKETELRLMEPSDLFGAVESPVFDLTHERFDCTDVIVSPSLWAPVEELRRITHEAGLNVVQSSQFLSEPEEFLQSGVGDDNTLLWHEHPLMAIALDQAWKRYITHALRSSLRTAAILSVFEDSILRQQKIPISDPLTSQTHQ